MGRVLLGVMFVLVHFKTERRGNYVCLPARKKAVQQTLMDVCYLNSRLCILVVLVSAPH